MRKMILSQPNINYMMNMTKKFLNGKIDDIAYTLDFPYELEKRYEKMHREDDDYCELIHEYLYEKGIALYYKLSEAEFKELIQEKYDYIKQIASEGFY